MAVVKHKQAFSKPASVPSIREICFIYCNIYLGRMFSSPARFLHRPHFPPPLPPHHHREPFLSIIEERWRRFVGTLLLCCSALMLCCGEPEQAVVLSKKAALPIPFLPCRWVTIWKNIAHDDFHFKVSCENNSYSISLSNSSWRFL